MNFTMLPLISWDSEYALFYYYDDLIYNKTFCLPHYSCANPDGINLCYSLDIWHLSDFPFVAYFIRDHVDSSVKFSIKSNLDEPE